MLVLADSLNLRKVFCGMTLALLLMAPTVSGAGNSASPIERILLYDGGMLIYVYPRGGIASPASCGNGSYFTISMSRPMAKEYVAGLIAAQISGAVVTIWGKNACIDQPYAETLDYFRVETP